MVSETFVLKMAQTKLGSGLVLFVANTLDSGLEAHLLFIRNVELPEVFSPLEELGEHVLEEPALRFGVGGLGLRVEG